MNDNKTNTGSTEEKSALDLVEEALVGTHQEVPPNGASENEDDGDNPPVPGHRSP